MGRKISCLGGGGRDIHHGRCPVTSEGPCQWMGGADKIEKCFRNIKKRFKNQFNRAIEKKKPEIPTLITLRD